MIKCEKGMVEIKGGASNILGDLACIVKAVREALTAKYDEDFAERNIRKAISLSKMTGDELDEEYTQELLKTTESLQNMLKALREGLK